MSFYTFSFKPRPVVYVSVLFIMLACMAVIVWSAQYYFLKMGDLLKESEAVAIQHATDKLCLYDSRAANNHMAYKFALYRKVQPKVVVIGSSRVLQFGSPMFIDSFINMGRTMNYLLEGQSTLDRLLEYGKPKLILLGIDFWWFNPNYRIRWGQAKKLIEIESGNPAMLKSLIKNSFSHPQFLSYAMQAFSKTSCHLGVAAKTYLNGFGPDGFRYHGSKFVTGNIKSRNIGFADTLRRIRKGNSRFEHGNIPDPKKIDRFVSLTENIKQKGIRLVIFVPPVAPAIAEAMDKSGNYKFVGKTLAALRKRGLMIHDFHNPKQLGLNDCNFLDGFHGGDTASAQMLHRMAKIEVELGKTINNQELARLSQFSNRAEIYFSEAFGRAEPDFLGLGCVKSK